MQNRKSTASILLFVGSVLCFFLPFVTVSCGGEKLFTLSGRQLATGSSVSVGEGKPEKTSVDPTALIALLCALAGVGLTLAGSRMATAQAVAGAAGTVSLAIMGAQMQDRVHQQTQGMGASHLESGYWLTLLVLVAATAWSVYLRMRAGKQKVAEEKPPQPSTVV